MGFGPPPQMREGSNRVGKKHPPVAGNEEIETIVCAKRSSRRVILNET